MATNTSMDSGTDDLFQRKATGLLRGWSVWDGFIYAAFSINLITLGLLGLSYAPFVPNGSLIMGVILAGLYLVFQAVTYAALIAVMPRAGGDYVWTSRVLGGGIGFVLAVTGWWFILWHWVPIYADLLNKEVLVPLARSRTSTGRSPSSAAPRALRLLDGRRAPGLGVRLARDARLRPHPEVLLLRRSRRARDHDRAPARQLERRLRLRLQPRGERPLRRGRQRLPADRRGRRGRGRPPAAPPSARRCS